MLDSCEVNKTNESVTLYDHIMKISFNKVDLLDAENILTTTVEKVIDTKNTMESTVSVLRQALRRDIKQTLETSVFQSLFDSQQEDATNTEATIVALRVRELVGDVNECNNVFVQPVQILNAGTAAARKLWNAPHPRPPSMSGYIEWSNGGCPFHENYYDVVTP